MESEVGQNRNGRKLRAKVSETGRRLTLAEEPVPKTSDRLTTGAEDSSHS